MEVGEIVTAFETLVSTEEQCDEEDSNEDKGWTARINKGVGSDSTTCSGTQLYKFMKNHTPYHGKSVGWLRGSHPFVEKPDTTGYPWEFKICTPTHFPLQAHHLIPKNHLPKHGVCAFLAAGYKDNPDYKLANDTKYNTDHRFNGYCMPYATPLAEWTKVRSNNEKKLELCRDLMDKTGRQLHQGSHKAKPYVDPTEAHEEDDIHLEDKFGYLDKIDLLLKVVQDAAKAHSNTCNVCKEKKKDMPPRETPVRHVDQVSGLVKLLIDANRIFVSEAAFLVLKKKVLEAPDWLTGGGPTA